MSILTGTGLRVKPLEWKHNKGSDSFYPDWESGPYRIADQWGKGFFLEIHGIRFEHEFSKLAAAQCAAEEHHVSTITASLEVDPAFLATAAALSDEGEAQ